MFIAQIVLLVLLVMVYVAVMVTLVRVLKGAVKRRLLDETRFTLCDSSEGVGISVLCCGVRGLEQVAVLLDVGYGHYEVVLVIDAGRHPEVFEAIVSHYYLISVGHTFVSELPADGVHGFYRSRKRCFRRLVVVDKAFTSATDGLDSAVGVATYDYVLPMREGWRLMPNAIGRLVAELSEHPAHSVDLVQSMVGVPALLLSREAVVAAGGFARRPWRKVPRRRRCTVYEPLLRSDRPPLHIGRRWSLWWALLLTAGIVAAAAAGRWGLCAVLLTAAVIWSAVRVAAPLVTKDTGFAVDGLAAVDFLFRKFNVKNFTMS